MAEKLIITAALTGAITVPTQNPHLPFAPEHLIADAEACVKAGASAVHVHARNPKTGQPSSDPDLFAPVLAGIHAKTDAVVGISNCGVELCEVLTVLFQYLRCCPEPIQNLCFGYYAHILANHYGAK